MKHFLKRALGVVVITLGMVTLVSALESSADKKIRIVLVGDSTVNDGGGWGDGFKRYLTGNVECINTAANGRSSKSFMAEGRWEAALKLKGDYYLIQFGHNDEPGKGPDRETDPATTYTQNLARYVDEARAMGAKPILVTSLTRRNFDPAGSGHLVPSLVPYVEAMKKLAAQKNVPLIDLHARSVELCETLGVQKTAAFNAVKDGKPDTTHLSFAGRLTFGRIMVEEVRKAVPGLSPYLRYESSTVVGTKTNVFDVKEYGATGDGHTVDTTGIQTALDTCAAAGGGVVRFPPGTYLSAPIFLKGDGLTLELEAGAKLQASSKFLDFINPARPAAVFALVNASNLNDLTIRGRGVIDGAGAGWWPAVRQAKAAGVPESRRRPRLVVLSHCVNVQVSGITLQNSPSFHLVPSDCEEVTIEGVTVHAPADSPNTDAMDPSACRHVTIAHCTLDVGDDNIAIKSGHLDDTYTNATEDFLVENCTFLHGHGMSIGSETIGGVKDLIVRNCTFKDTASGIRIKSDRTRGGLVEGCLYQNLTMKNVKVPVNITSYYPKVPVTDAIQPLTDTTPRYRNLKIVNLIADSPQSAGWVVGLPESRVTGLQFENVKITAPQGLTIRNARAVQFKDSEIKVASGRSLILETNAEVTGLK